MHRWTPLVLLLIPTFVGCKTQDPAPVKSREIRPASIVLRIKASPNLNPNDLGEPTPVDLRVYQLRNRKVFTEASFEDLWVKDKAVLDSSLIGERVTFTFKPQPETDAVLAKDLSLDPATNFYGLMGLFSAERKEGLEMRKVVVSWKELKEKVIYLNGHQIEIRSPLDFMDELGEPLQEAPEDEAPDGAKDGDADAKDGDGDADAKDGDGDADAKDGDAGADAKDGDDDLPGDGGANDGDDDLPGDGESDEDTDGNQEGSSE